MATFLSRPFAATDAVPTGFARGPDGAIYLGQLTGVPFADGAANIAVSKMAPTRKKKFLPANGTRCIRIQPSMRRWSARSELRTVRRVPCADAGKQKRVNLLMFGEPQMSGE